jgi:hypothetical protein
MRKAVRTAAFAAALVAAGAARANAQWSWSGCGGAGSPGFNTCASVTMSWASNVLTLTVQNWGTYNPATNSFASLGGSSIFTTLGLQNYGSGSITGISGTPSCAGGTVSDACSWVYGSNLTPLSNFGGTWVGADRVSQGGVNNGLNPPPTPGAGTYTQVVINFTTTGTIDLSAASFALHGQSGPVDLNDPTNTCSTKLLVTKSGATYTPNSTTATTCDVSVVPEPASMMLIATGLVAMGGVGFMRRRKG